MLIRHAREKDMSHILDLMRRLVIFRDADLATGFVEYLLPSESLLRECIKQTPFFFVAEELGNIIGFLSCYPSSLLHDTRFSGDAIIQHLLARKQSFLYWELLGVDRLYHQKGIGTALTHHFLHAITYSSYTLVYAAVAHKPHMNSVSSALLVSCGFVLDNEIIFDCLVFGIYKKII